MRWSIWQSGGFAAGRNIEGVSAVSVADGFGGAFFVEKLFWRGNL